jgi:hypothetical protein
MLTTLTKTIQKKLQTNDRVVVYTNNDTHVQDFLTQCSGRWQVAVNPYFWSRGKFVNDKFTNGPVKDGFKIGFVSKDERFPGETIGLDTEHGCRLVFTKNPFFAPNHKSYIIKTELSFPPTSIEPHLPPLLAIQKNTDSGIVFINRSKHDYNGLHDQLIMQDIEHSLGSSGERKGIHLVWPPKFLEGDNIILYDMKHCQELFAYHGFKAVTVVRNIDQNVNLKFDDLHRILSVFTEVPHSAINVDFIAVKVWLHPKTILKCMAFLVEAGCLAPVRTDDGRIQVYKKGPGPKNDALFHRIPEGEMSAYSLANHLQINRTELFSLLKGYEGSGIIFSYVIQKNQKLWKYIQELTREKYAETIERIRDTNVFLESLMSQGEKFLNSYLEEKIQRLCLERAFEAELVSNHRADKIRGSGRVEKLLDADR